MCNLKKKQNKTGNRKEMTRDWNAAHEHNESPSQNIKKKKKLNINWIHRQASSFLWISKYYFFYKANMQLYDYT